MLEGRASAGDFVAKYKPTEPMQGDVDGVNRTFRTSLSWRPGTLQVFNDGLAITPDDDDGWTETAPRTIVLNEAPLPGQRIAARYIPV